MIDGEENRFMVVYELDKEERKEANGWRENNSKISEFEMLVKERYYFMKIPE
jgi:hypothetical protein